MNIKCKFELDEEVWVLEKKHIYEKCNICDDGKVIIKEESFRCPKCKGVSNGNYVRAEYEIQSYFITSVQIARSYCFIDIKYNLRRFYERTTYDEDGNEYDHDVGVFDENEIFALEEEALIECNKINSEPVEPSPWVKVKLLSKGSE